MKKGDVINGYTVLTDFSTAGGGLSKWCFVGRSGKEYFLKEFLDPTFPTPEGPGSARLKEERRERCRVFEEHHQRIRTAVNSKCSEGGNLIYTVDFFRHHAKYYKVTEKVQVSGLSPVDISKLSEERKLLILKTVAHSLRILHSLGIVHGDLKPDNVLIKQTAMGHYTSKLIDFDNSYFSGNPPANPEDVVGDMSYYSPELATYISKGAKAKAEDLTTYSDVFALGLLFHLYLTGVPPLYDRTKTRYPWGAVLEGGELRLKTGALPPKLVPLLQKMLALNAADRGSVEWVFEYLKKNGPGSPSSPAPAPAAPVRLGGTLLKKEGGPAPAAPAESGTKDKAPGRLLLPRRHPNCAALCSKSPNRHAVDVPSLRSH